MFTIQCDFDDTITVGDLGTSIVDAFGSKEWERSEELYLDGKIGVEETSRIQYGLVRTTRKEVEAFISRNTCIREGFVDFVAYCRERGLSFVIVSSGLDIYIEPTLERLNLSDVELYSAKGIYANGGIDVQYRDPMGRAIEAGFKEAYLKHLKERGLPMVYIGDSMSDIEPAKGSDHVFARGKLADVLKREGVGFHHFDTFHDVTRAVDELVANRQPE